VLAAGHPARQPASQLPHSQLASWPASQMASQGQPGRQPASQSTSQPASWPNQPDAGESDGWKAELAYQALPGCLQVSESQPMLPGRTQTTARLTVTIASTSQTTPRLTETIAIHVTIDGDGKNRKVTIDGRN